MKQLKFAVEYALVKTLDAAINALPRKTAIRAGENLGSMLAILLKRRTKLVTDNLARAFPSNTPSQNREIARRVWRNVGRVAVEFMRAPEFIKRGGLDKAPTSGLEHMEKAGREGRGAIVVAAHFANWEINGMLGQRRYKDSLVVGRPMKNPLVERWVQSKRALSGIQFILHRDAVRACLKALRQKKYIGILVDQNLYQGGAFVDFFGRPAATTTLPALLHVRTGAPVLITYALREGDNFRNFYEPIAFPADVPAGDRVQRYTQIISDRVEQLVRRQPDQWFWVHNRWKRQPE